MPNIPANLYFGPELPDSALPGAIFNDGTCLYRGGEHGWLYMCHVSTVQKMKNSPLADYAIAIPEGELASLNEPMATYREGHWLLLSSQVDDITVVGLVLETSIPADVPDESIYVRPTEPDQFGYGNLSSDLSMIYRHKGKDYLLDKQQNIPSGHLYPMASQMLNLSQTPMNRYLDLDISARFVVNTALPPEPGDTWVDNEFNEFVFSPTKNWECIGKLAFNYKGSMPSGIDVLRTMGPHQTGDSYLVDNFVYVYNAVVKRFVVIQCAPGSDDVPFNFYPPGALEPIPIQGIYRRSTDALPSEPNGCGYIVIENDGGHALYNQYGLLIEVTLPEAVEFPSGKRAPMVTMGDSTYRNMCYQWDGLDPEDGDVWLYNKQLFTYYANDWRLLPAGIPYTSRHNTLLARVQELKDRIRLGDEMGNPLLSEQDKEMMFNQYQLEYERNNAPEAEQHTEHQRWERDHPIRAFIRRLCSSKAR